MLSVEGFQRAGPRGSQLREGWHLDRPSRGDWKCAVNDPQPRPPWEPILLRLRLPEFVYFDGLNRFYVAREHSDLKNYFSAPVVVVIPFRDERNQVRLSAGRVPGLEQDKVQRAFVGNLSGIVIAATGTRPEQDESEGSRPFLMVVSIVQLRTAYNEALKVQLEQDR